MQQALERAGIKSNHGWDYAMNAIEMATLMRQLRSNLLTPFHGTTNQPMLGSLPNALENEPAS
jgi:6,7-dimethyl-8-ribityllumazine synthase